MSNNKKVEKLKKKVKPLELQKGFLQKILTPALFFYWLLLPTMADTSFFLIECMKRKHAVNLESIWETDWIITRFPA